MTDAGICTYINACICQHIRISDEEFSIPYLQLDTPGHHEPATKQRLARLMAETYSRLMTVDIRRISVAVRELGDGGLWRMPASDADPVPVSLLMLDIRHGRSADLRMTLAKALCKHCVDVLGLSEDRLNVEFTQHSGDEMYHPTLGGYSPDWSPEGA